MNIYNNSSIINKSTCSSGISITLSNKGAVSFFFCISPCNIIYPITLSRFGLDPLKTNIISYNYL